jgi:site-specific recombinase XerD
MGFSLFRNSIRFYYYIKGKQYAYSTKIKIYRSEWDLKSQRPKARRGKTGEANRNITHELNEYQRAYDILKSKYKESLTKEIVKREFDRHFQLAQTVKTLTYSDYFEIYLQQKKESDAVKKDSWQKYTRIHTAIMAMQKKAKKTYYLKDFDNAFFMDFIAYLRTEKDISDNTLQRKLGFFKSFLNWCIVSGYQVNMDFKKVRVKTRETSHVSLTEQELEILTKVELSDRLDYYRDLFLIGVYSGQRYSDYSRFNKKYIEGDNIKIRAKKTGQFSYIPLSKKLTAILDKYDWKLKTISSQKFNIAIQEICKIAGFDEIIQVDKFYGSKKVSKDVPKWKMIASHTARRTFITLCLMKGVPEPLVMQVTGIKSLKTLQGYIRFDKKLNKTISQAWD